MYFEEKMIDGVMCFRTTPDGEWRPFDIKELSRRYAAALSDDGWKQRCEELEVAAAAMYLGHDNGRELFEMYKSVYLSTSDDDTTWKPTEDEPFPY